MKATKKIIIGLVAVVALLITIAGALADTSINTWQPNNSAVTTTQNVPVNFSLTIANPEEMNLNYQWVVDNGPPVFTENHTNPTHTSNYQYPAATLGSHVVSVFITGGSTPLQRTWTVQVNPAAPASLLSVTKVEVNGKTNGKLTLSEVNEIEVEISNDYTEDIEDIEVTVRILDVDGDDLEEEAEISEIKDGDEDTVTVEFDLSNEDVDENEYTIEIEVTGEATDNTDHSDTEKVTVDVDRENDDIVITKTDLEDSQVLCSAPQTSLSVHIKNVGENDQNGAKITVKNTELGVNLQRDNIDLDDYSGSDNDYQATFALNLEDAKTGSYMLDIAVYSEDNDLMDTKEVELQVQCADSETPSQENEESGQYADKELAAELQKKIDDYKAMQSQNSQANFRESNAYVMMLGILVAMMFFAAALSVTYMLVKRK